MNDSTSPDPLHQACISIGSNIHPVENLQKAVPLLREQVGKLQLSACYETQAVGSPGPNFLNLAVCLLTPLDAPALKKFVLAPIEQQLGRVRSSDKNAPRTIDLDIIVFDHQVVDAELWRRVYLALPVSELLPDLRHPETSSQLQRLPGSWLKTARLY